MQDKTHKSQLIRLNNLANKKARRRLIGSIFLLIIALLILFHVTSKIRPIPIKPESIEIKTHSTKINSITSNINPIIVESKSDVMNNLDTESHITHINNATMVESKTSALINPQKSNNLSAVNATNTHKIKSSQPSSNTTRILDNNDSETAKPVASKEIVTAPTIHLNPTIAIEQSAAHKPSPEEILNGILPEKTPPKYFVQLMASGDKAKLMAAKTKLAHAGIYVNLQSAKHGSNTIYRLRVGPFNDKAKAKAKLSDIQNKLNN